jgi:hypothetical protein
MVYGQLLAEQLSCPVYIMPEDNRSSYNDPVPIFIRMYPHISDRNYVDEQTYSELAESWYRLSLFRLDCLSDVSSFFTRDVWGLYLESRQYVRHVQVQI